MYKGKFLILILIFSVFLLSCEEEDNFEPNNLITLSENEKAEIELAKKTGAPYIESFSFSASKTYEPGEKIIIFAKFTKKTRISNGSIPRLTLDIGGKTRNAIYVSGSDSNDFKFRFEYTVANGDMDHNGIEVKTPINRNGADIEDHAGQKMIEAFTEPTNTAGKKVDGSNLVATLDDGAFTNDITPSITLSANGASNIYIGTGCRSGGALSAYATSTSSYTLPNANGANTFSLAVENGTGGFSRCVTFNTTHDNQAPDPAVGPVTVDGVASDIESDLTNWSASSGDNGPSGFSHYELAVSTTNNVGGIVANGDFRSVGNVLTGTVTNGPIPFLTILTNYYTLIRAVDNAGNTSSVIASPVWQLAALAPEQIVSMNVVNATDTKIKVGWPYPDDNGFVITDYVIEYKEDLSDPWITINDGVSTDRRYELTGLSPDSTYYFRVRAYNGTNYGAWAPTLTAETLPAIDFISTPYQAINIGGATLNQIVSLEDDNEIYYGDNTASTYNDGSLISADLDRGKFASVPANKFTVVVATKPFFIAGRLGGTGNDTTKANIVWQTSSWIGKQFIFSHSRTNPMKVNVYAFSDSVVTITKNGAAVPNGIRTINEENGHTFTISSYGSYEINSTGFIAVYGYANGGGGSYVDPKPFLPASNDLVGVPSRDAKVSTIIGSNQLDVYHSNNTTESKTVNPGVTGNIDQRGTSGVYRDAAIRIRADHPIVANSYADANGSCSAPLVPVAFQKTKFAINVQAEWVAMASTNEVTITAYEPNATYTGWEAPRVYNLVRSGTNNNTPTKGYETNRNFRAGTIFEGDAPFQMWYEPRTDTNGARRDETIMFGWD